MRTSVFIGGSRSIRTLPEPVITRLSNIINRGLPVLVGDASGIDNAVQSYFHHTNYRDVLVYCVNGKCRNNVGHWPVCSCAVPTEAKDFSYYSSKDLHMALDAAYGFMVWDGESAGTLNNVMNLITENKPVLVYFEPDKIFHTLRTVSELPGLLIRCSNVSLAQFDMKLSLPQFLKKTGNPTMTETVTA